jgi:hypothetical protein
MPAARIIHLQIEYEQGIFARRAPRQSASRHREDAARATAQTSQRSSLPGSSHEVPHKLARTVARISGMPNGLAGINLSIVKKRKIEAIPGLDWRNAKTVYNQTVNWDLRGESPNCLSF